MSVITIKKISDKEIKDLIIKQETLQALWSSNLIPTPTDNENEFTINTITATRLGKIFGRNIFGKRFNNRFIKRFTKLSPTLTIGLVGSKLTIDVYDVKSKELIIDTFTSVFDDVQGLTIEIIQHFMDTVE